MSEKLVGAEGEAIAPGTCATRRSLTKSAVVALLGCLFVFSSTAPAVAGSVEVGLADSQQFDQWLCNGVMPPDKSGHPSSCGTAKFQECSSCEQLVISNHSDVAVTPDIVVSGLGFRGEDVRSISPVMLLVMSNCPAAPGRKGGSAISSCSNLAPGRNCYIGLEFCPAQSGTTEAQLKVTVEEGTAAKVTTFTLSGRADYPPELVAADEVRQRHLSELMKIPKVHWVSLDKSEGKILIDVLVEQNEDGSKTPENIKEVRREVPTEIEGYEVEVTEYIPIAYFL